MQDTNRQSPPADDEINLVDLWRVLAKRKALVMVMPVLSLLLAAVYLLITPAVFESRAVIQVGQVEVPAVLVQRLKEQYRVDDKEAATEMPRVTNISVDKKGASNIITILAQDSGAEGAQKHLTQVVQALLAEHTKLYSQTMDTQRQRLHSLDKQITLRNDLMVELTVHIEAVHKQDPAQGVVLAIEKGGLLTEALGLGGRIRSPETGHEQYPIAADQIAARTHFA
jgi:uncharacterized protein involved in exopolysaccharide biosynthesis